MYKKQQRIYRGNKH